MTNQIEQQQVTPTSELAQAFLTTVDPKQVGGGYRQEGGEGVETSSTTTSRLEPGTTDPSRSDADKSKEDVLANLTLAELQAHPTLGPALKSFADKEAARQLKGATTHIRNQVREEVTMEFTKRHFDSLSKQDLVEELASDPKAAEAYGKVMSAPPPTPEPTPDQQGIIAYYTGVIQKYSSKLAEAGLPADVALKLDPKTYLQTEGDSEELLSNWTTAIDDAILTKKVADRTGSLTSEEAKSRELEKQAIEDEAKPKGSPAIQNGRQVSPIPAVDGTSSGMALLSDAFARRRN